MKPFAHLHLHTEYSLLDGAARIDRVFDRAREKGITALAITDHGCMFGALEFWKKGRETGIKPIIGCEFYTAPDMHAKDGKNFFHLVLLAKNNTGYKNIIKLDSLAYIDGFYYKPRIDMELLRRHTEGVVCLSACLGGEIPQLLLQHRYEDAKAVAQRFKEMFGEDFYLELQDHKLPEQKLVNPLLIRMARELDIKLVATNDVHYIDREDAEAHDVLLCVQTGKNIDDPNRMRFETEEFYLKDYDEMAELFGSLPEALDNTLEIAEKCDMEFLFHQPLLPNYVPADGTTPREFLRNLAEAGIKRRYGDKVTDEIVERMNYELGIIDRMGFNEYYLIVWDFINYAKSIGIPVGAGRGSGVGSIVAYAVGITNVEPLQYNLLFERFLNPERQSMPDFDVDFCFERRGEVIEYVKQKYGEGKVCQIVTFGTMAAKNAVKDVARVFRVPYADSDRITKAMTGKGGICQQFGLGKFEGNPEIPELAQMYRDDPTVRKVVDMAIKLEDMPRNCSKHAAGVVICKDVISDHVPMSRNGEDITTQFNMIEVEELGLLKMDFLGLKTLTDVKKAIDYTEITTGKRIDFDKMPYTDRGAYELIGSGDTDAVFQLESAGMKRFMRELQPDNLEDIIAGISLYRPGPMNSIPKYIEGKKNQDKVTYKHPMLESILNVTYGCMVYQEQVMQVCQKMAGFSFGQADMVRRAMGKKDMKKMLKMKNTFIYGETDENGVRKVDGAVNRGVPEAVAKDIFEEMEGFAKYAFNKSHAAAYAVLAYQTAYLKKYHRTEFVTSVLNNRITNIEEITKYVTYCRESGITVYPPDINRSKTVFWVENNGIRFGLSAIKNVGGAAAQNMEDEREKNGPYKSLSDFFARVDLGQINKRTVESLIKAGAFDCLGATRAQMMAGYEQIMERRFKDNKQRECGQISLFGDILEDDEEDTFPDVGEYDPKIRLHLEKEVLGVYVSGHPLEEHREQLKKFTFNTQMLQNYETDEAGNVTYLNLADNQRVTAGGEVADFRKIVTKNGSEMGILRLEDLYGSVECVLFARAYESARPYLEKGSLIWLSGSLNIRPDEAVKIRVDAVHPFEEKAAPPPRPRPAPDKRPAGETRRLYLRFTAADFDEITDILQNYPGPDEVIAKIDGNAVRMEQRVSESTGLKNELLSLLDESDFLFKTV